VRNAIGMAFSGMSSERASKSGSAAFRRELNWPGQRLNLSEPPIVLQQ